MKSSILRQSWPARLLGCLLLLVLVALLARAQAWPGKAPKAAGRVKAGPALMLTANGGSRYA